MPHEHDPVIWKPILGRGFMHFRILERSREMFYVQYKGWFGWSDVERHFFSSLEDARYALDRIKRSWEWVPKVHDSKSDVVGKS